MLHGRLRAMRTEVQARIRDVRTDRANEVFDEIEASDAGISEELELALIQMKAGMLRRVDEALARLEAGEYGYCFECRGEISEKRLHALPFAVRCTACEDRLEQGEERTRHAAAKHAAPSLFAGGTGY
jgi:DnaK suppressor protein